MQRVRVSSQRAAVHKLGDSQMTLSPKFRLAASIQSPLSLKGEPLIPGLPDDVALNCLLRVPVESHLSSRSVCKRWRLLFGTKEAFFARRKELGFKDPWLFVVGFSRCTGKIQWKVLDMRNLTWHEIPPMPCKDKVSPLGLRAVSIPHEGTMFICGGMVSDSGRPLDLSLKYDMVRNHWTVTNKMITARSFLNANAANSQPVSNMVTNMASYDTTVLNGKLLVTEGWIWPFFVPPRGEVYDPRTDQWETKPMGFREGRIERSVEIYDRLFIVSELERMKMKVCDPVTGLLETINGPGLPEQICRPFAVNCYGNRVYVVGQNLQLAVGKIWRSENKFGVRWELVKSPERYADLTPSNSLILFA